MKVEVRCCCQPMKLLGTVIIDDRLMHADSVTFALRGNIDDRHQKILTLPLAMFADGGRTWIAVKAEGVDLDTLRRIPYFVEARS